jgi:hypothetical protein
VRVRKRTGRPKEGGVRIAGRGVALFGEDMGPCMFDVVLQRLDVFNRM